MKISKEFILYLLSVAILFLLVAILPSLVGLLRKCYTRKPNMKTSRTKLTLYFVLYFSLLALTWTSFLSVFNLGFRFLITVSLSLFFLPYYYFYLAEQVPKEMIKDREKIVKSCAWVGSFIMSMCILQTLYELYLSLLIFFLGMPLNCLAHSIVFLRYTVLNPRLKKSKRIGVSLDG